MEEEFTHRIPVEITLPLSRVKDVNSIRTGIETFDVDVLSARSLIVTGVLTLDGVDLSNSAQGAWPPQEEEVSFSHRIEEEPSQESEPTQEPLFGKPPVENESGIFSAEENVAAEPNQPGPPEVPQSEMSMWTEPDKDGQEDASNRGWFSQAKEEQGESAQLSEAEATSGSQEEKKSDTVIVGNMGPQSHPEAAAGQGASDPPEAGGNPGAAAKPNEPDETPQAETILADENQEPVADAAVSEKQEIKIAFAGKSADTVEQEPVSVNKIMSQAAGTLGRLQEQALEAQAQSAAEQRDEQDDPKDRLEWKKLFLNPSSEQPAFRRVRMCIVQKEDTIETIAERYQKNPRELMLHNRLTGEYLQEGQIIFIP